MWHVFASERIAGSRGWRKVESQLRADQVDFQLVVSTSRADHDALVDSSIQKGARRFVSAGGDGATQLLVNALLQHSWDVPPTIALLPLGSGCDLPRSLGISNVIQASRLLKASSGVKTKEIDLGIAKGDWGTRYFVNVASVGLTAAIVRRSTQFSWLGAMRYLAAFWLVLPTYTRRGFHVERDNEATISSSILGVLANGKFFGGGFQVAPTASMDDAMLEFLIASAGRTQMISVLYRLWRGTHLRSSFVSTAQVSETRVACDPPTEVEADGEYLGMTPVEFGVRAKAIRVVCPLRSF